MREFFIYALQNFLVLDVLILILWLLEGRFSWKSGHLWRKWLWLFVCIRMLLPVEIHLQDLNQGWKGWQIQLEMETEESSRTDREQEEEIRINGEPTLGQMPSGDTVPAQSEDSAKEEVLSENNGISTEAETGKQEFFPGFIWKHKAMILAGIWLLGFLVLLFYHVLQYYLMRDFFFADARTCQDEKVTDLMRSWCRRYHIKKSPVLLWKEQIPSPMTFGYFRKKLVFPPELFAKEEMPLVLRHELMHLKYRDSWYKAIILVVCDLYWFNPVFWLMKKLAFQDVEYVCDERVTREMKPEEKQRYGAAIVKAARFSTGKPVPAMVPFALRKKDLKKRMHNLFAFRGWRGGFFPFLLALLSVGLLEMGITVSVKEVPVLAAAEQTPVNWENEEVIAGTYLTDDLQALNRQKDAKSSYITDRFTGFNHYYIDKDGTLWGTGENDNWQLGITKESDINNLDITYTEPVKIAEHVVHVDANVNSTFVIWITEDGRLYGQGANTWGVLRIPMKENEPWNPWLNLAEEPQLLMDHVTYASAGQECISVLTEDGKAWWWGRMQATTGTEGPGSMFAEKPRLMLENARYTVCGLATAAAIDEENRLWLWGCNVWGQCATEGEDYLKDPYMACTDVEMVWTDFLSTRQNVFAPESWMGMNPYHMSEKACIHDYTTFIRKTDGQMYACGMDLGALVKSVQLYGDLYIENSERPEDYVRSYSPYFLPIEIEEG